MVKKKLIFGAETPIYCHFQDADPPMKLIPTVLSTHPRLLVSVVAGIAVYVLTPTSLRMLSSATMLMPNTDSICVC